MKNLILVGGPMGVGKTAAGQLLKKQLDRCVFLDGDWCWDMHPFQVTEETKAMVLDNICSLLGNFLRCSAYKNVVFCWVMHRQEIIDEILSRLPLDGCRVTAVSLLCSEGVLSKRVQQDVRRGLRSDDVLVRSLNYLPLYAELNTVKIDVSALTAEQTAEHIEALLC